ncbi:MAG: GNAT family N-acetyltransferase [Albidovulum sp.]
MTGTGISALTRATPEEAAEIAAFLGLRPELAMFPLGNLATFGMSGGSDYAMRFWLARSAAGAITDVLGCTDAGIVMPRLPSADFSAAAAVLRGRQISGIIGPKPDARGLEAAAKTYNAPKELDRDEPHFFLDLDDLTVPAGIGRIVPLEHAPREVMLGWMADYRVEALNTPAQRAREMAEVSHSQYLERGSHVVLMHGDVPLAMTGFNAALPNIVQIGGVYTPPNLRGRGHARRAVALHLDQVRGAGVQRAALFSASDGAARTYQALGFRMIGEWTLVLFDGDLKIDG